MKVKIIRNTLSDGSKAHDVKINDETGGHCFVECRSVHEARKFIEGFEKLLNEHSTEFFTDATE